VTDTPYTRDILRLAADVPHREGFVFDGVEQRSRACGSRVRMAVTLDGEGRVAGLTQAVEACAFGQAAAALVGAHAIGRSLGEAEAAAGAVAAWLGGGHEPDWPGIAALDPVRARAGRHGAVLLPFQALAAAIREAGK
jgi:NifU-like protein involved in Fe-S cluster formation